MPYDPVHWRVLPSELGLYRPDGSGTRASLLGTTITVTMLSGKLFLAGLTLRSTVTEGCAMRRLIRVAGTAVAVLVMASALTASSSVSAQTRRVPRSAPSFSVVITSGESFADAVRRAARAPGGGQVALTIEAMLRRVEAGQVAHVPEGTRRGVISVRATVAELRAALSAARSLGARSVSRAAAGIAARAVPLSVPPVAGTGCFSVSYNGKSWFSTWCDLQLYLDDTVCGEFGCEQVDRLTATMKTNPGALTSAVSFTASNMVTPGFSSVYTDVHINWNTLCYSSKVECGHGSTGNFNPSGSGRMSPTSDVALYGDEITHSFYLWALFIPNGQEYASDASTGTATCKPASSGSNQCLYPSLIG